MKKYVFLFSMSIILLFFSISLSHAAGDLLENAKIIKTEFYGDNFTVYFDKTHLATACGHNKSVSMMVTSSTGRAHMALMLTAWSTGKSVTVNISDSVCNGDRPTINNFHAY